MIRPSRPVILSAVAGLLVLAVAIVGALHLDHATAQRRAMLALPPEAVPGHPALVRLASADAGPLYAEHCARCHGAHMHGRVALGAPDLTDGHWLFGSGRMFDIERTILFGIRSGNGKARNVAEMPAFGQTGVLKPAEIRALVSYLLSLNHRTDDADMAAEGKAVYLGRGGCSDCHGGDARGNPDYGAPDLTAGRWTNGADANALYDSIYYGRHNICPAWYGKLTLLQIRELAVDIYVASHPKATPDHSEPAHDQA